MAMPPALNDAQTEEAVQLYMFHEWPSGEIAEHFGVAKTTVQQTLLRAGVRLRTSAPEKVLRVKQCSKCLHFLPMAAFYQSESCCMSCKNNPPSKPWAANPNPLAQAIMNWRTQ